MFQRLLAERFGLAVHIEPREMPVYALMLARKDGRLGPRIKPADRDCLALMTAGPGGLPVAAPQLPDGRPACGARRDGSGRLAVGGSDMRMFATQMLTGQVDRLVIDRTGLAGAYDFDLEYAVEAAGRGGGPSDPATAVSDRASLFTALQEQLGLRLEPLRASVDVMVIDRVAPPTEN